MAVITSATTLNGQDREHTLRVYNWSDYIDETVLDDFEVWYKEQTGEEVKVVYQLFDLNETMLSKIEKGHADFDVVCPSDYIIERMLHANLLLPIDKDFGGTPNYIDANLSPYIKECFDKIGGGGLNANDYAVGYMWGTTGILYNRKYVTDEEAGTWDILRNKKFAGKIFVKDSFRDVYPQILQFLKYQQILDGTVTRDEIAVDASDESIAMVEDFMKDVKPLVAGWEADFGKDFMTKEKGYVNLQWSGDAVWAIWEAAKVGVDLAYVVPKEGSTVWFDGWVIPKYAVNTKAARYFINFMCQSEIALRNMDAIGYISALGTKEILEAGIDTTLENTVDVSYIFGPEATAVKLDPTQYPDISIIKQCAPERDSGERTQKLLEMWERIKGDNLGISTYLVIGVFAVLVGVVVAHSVLKRKRRSSPRRK